MINEFSKGQRIYLGLVLGWLLFSTTVVLLLSWSNPVHRAVLLMASGLILFWVLICGSLMVRFREPITAWVQGLRVDWRLRFVLFSTLLAMVEEAITTGMTNLAPQFGVKIGQAYITASANYFDVVCLHSVVVLVSLFVGWAAILNFYKFTAFEVFILFGISGTIAEMCFGGPQHILEYAMWSFVYGLMVWLPTRSVPQDRAAKTPKNWLYPAAVIIPFFFLLLFPLSAVVGLAYPSHPSVHFPPIK